MLLVPDGQLVISDSLYILSNTPPMTVGLGQSKVGGFDGCVNTLLRNLICVVKEFGAQFF